MAKNIYDLFNERKNGIDYLVEGLDPTEFADLEAYEDLDAAAEALETITTEATNEMIEFQAASYLEDLVLENMMYTDFDEEKIQATMEAAKEEKKEGLGQKIKNLWARIKEWFARVIRTISTHFQSGESLVAKYRKQIPTAMNQSKAKISYRPFNDPDNVKKQIEGMVGRLKVVGKSKEQILGLVGLSDKGGAKEKVENIAYTKKEKVEQPISGMKADVVIQWAGDKKVHIDGLKKMQKDLDGEFKQMLAEINKGEGKNKAEDAANFQFGIGVANSLISHMIVCVKQICNVCTAIIRKALSGKHDPEKKVNTTAANSQDRQDELKFNKKAYNKGYSAKDANAMSRKKVGVQYGPEQASYEPDVEGLEEGFEPDFEFIDEVEENNNDIEW